MYYYLRVHIFLLPKEGALVMKLPNLPKDDKVNKFDFISGKVHCLTLLSSYLEILITWCGWVTCWCFKNQRKVKKLKASICWFWSRRWISIAWFGDQNFEHVLKSYDILLRNRWQQVFIYICIVRISFSAKF